MRTLPLVVLISFVAVTSFGIGRVMQGDSDRDKIFDRYMQGMRDGACAAWTGVSGPGGIKVDDSGYCDHAPFRPNGINPDFKVVPIGGPK